MSEHQRGDRFEAASFEAAYEVEVDPEFPGDGVWTCPVFVFDGRGGVVDQPPPGTSPAVRVKTRDAEWVGRFPGLVSGGVFTGPSPAQLCLVLGVDTWVVDLGDPAAGADLVQSYTSQVVPVLEARLLLLAGYDDIVALGPDGVAWTSPRLGLIDLRVVRPEPDGIRCTGQTWDGVVTEFMVSPFTAEITQDQ